MKVLIDPIHAAPAIRALPPPLKRRLKAALRLLSKDPTGVTSRLDVKRLDADAGTPIYRLHIGEWRIAFTFDRDLVVLRVFPREHGYGWLRDMD